LVTYACARCQYPQKIDASGKNETDGTVNWPELRRVSAGFGRSAKVPNVRFLPLVV
jgi:hypothetical protein